MPPTRERATRQPRRRPKASGSGQLCFDFASDDQLLATALARFAALQPLSERLAEVVFCEIERFGRVLVKAHLADAIHTVLLRSGLARDLRWPSA